MTTPSPRDDLCPICGGDNRCGVRAGAGSCWCGAVRVEAAILDLVPEAARDRACLCSACAAGDPPSPCIKLCRLDPEAGTCIGCGRSTAEIAGWSRYSGVEKARVWLRRRGVAAEDRGKRGDPGA